MSDRLAKVGPVTNSALFLRRKMQTYFNITLFPNLLLAETTLTVLPIILSQSD